MVLFRIIYDRTLVNIFLQILMNILCQQFLHWGPFPRQYRFRPKPNIILKGLEEMIKAGKMRSAPTTECIWLCQGSVYFRMQRSVIRGMVQLQNRCSPSSAICMALLISSLSCSGSHLISISRNPLTIAAVASSALRPRDIRY